MANLTIRDIARLSGLSKSTVSLVLNNSPKVDPKTRRRVLAVMREHNYVPSFAATALAKGNTGLIGMIVPGLTWRFMANINYGVAKVIEDTKYEIVLFTSTNERDYSGAIDRVISSGVCAGLIVVAHDQQVLDRLVELNRGGMPTVLVDTLGAISDLPAVGADNYTGGLLVGRHLLGLGHRRIASILGPTDHPYVQERRRGLRDAMHEAGLEPGPGLEAETDFEEALIRSRTRELMRLSPDRRPTALFAYHDSAAFTVLNELAEAGVRVPEDVSVVGFNDIDAAAHVRPALTTVQQPFADMGRRAADILLTALDSTESDEISQRIVLPTKLIVRDSTGPATADR
ncbi:LacI family DNA-binding transcriptional regulator [Actinoallomurus bryophytorum]|uniref:LacI family transcriptional regulator n=1 Tax=Actinoallomurus bryophytorum TaxID=1490222 RepID=A0A543CUK9_9ACTN|nr:LacI family DNA-binding transcriptional regulator [Actinoallomurus bryophytorum]TQM00767.1 LacI family transcriptional regulator [Actinoallomurus bryophytorum]